jgi:hypothetical protein
MQKQFTGIYDERLFIEEYTPELYQLPVEAGGNVRI